ncbi:MAG: hypothetical protein IJH20_05495 [Bacilli bacterium]|nr:hypothetical protein [Bacilli bacterium]
MSNYFKNISDKDAYDILRNKFFFNYKYKLKSKITISEQFKLVARNINNDEIEILGKSMIEKINDIFMFINSKEDFYDNNKKNKAFQSYLKRATEFDIKTPIIFDLDGNELYDIYKKIFDIISDNYDFIDLDNKYNSAMKITNKYLSSLIVIYSEDINSIYDFIKNNSDISEELIEDHYDDFIYKYIDFWNSINFKQYNYLGIKLCKFKTKLKSYLFISDLSKSNFCNECLGVFKNPIDIQVYDNKLLYLIVSRFNPMGYMDDNNRIVLYWSLLEMLLTHKPNDNYIDDTIQKQLTRNITDCFQKYGVNKISKKEIRLLYDYRSVISHGEFLEIDKILNKIKKLNFINELKDALAIEDDLKKGDIVDIIRIRLLYIYSTIMKSYFNDYKYIVNLKEYRIKKKIIVDIIKNIFIKHE